MTCYLRHSIPANINIRLGQVRQGRVVLHLIKNLINHSSVTLCHSWIQLTTLIFAVDFGLIVAIIGR